jgi:hypothetical protein
MSENNPLAGWDKVFDIAAEQQVGDRYEGECLSETLVGRSKELGVAIFRRDFGEEAGTYFLRVTIANPRDIAAKLAKKRDTIRKLRGHADLDRYGTESEFLRVAEYTAGALAEDAYEKWGVLFKTTEVAKLAREETRKMMRAINA